MSRTYASLPGSAVSSKMRRCRFPPLQTGEHAHKKSEDKERKRLSGVQCGQSQIVSLRAAEEHVEKVPDLCIAFIQHLQKRAAMLSLYVTQLDKHLDDFRRGQRLDFLAGELWHAGVGFFGARLQMRLQRCHQERKQKTARESTDGCRNNNPKQCVLVSVASKDREHFERDGKPCRGKVKRSVGMREQENNNAPCT